MNEDNQYLLLLKRKQEEKEQEKQRIFGKLNPIIELIDCSYLVDISSKEILNTPDWYLYSLQLTYSVLNIENMYLSVSLVYEEGYAGADDTELIKFTCRYGDKYRFTENFKCIPLSEIDLDKTTEIIKILCLQTAVEMNFKNDESYFNTFFIT